MTILLQTTTGILTTLFMLGTQQKVDLEQFKLHLQHILMWSIINFFLLIKRTPANSDELGYSNHVY